MATVDLIRIEASEPRTTSRPHALPLGAVYTDLETFQWRVPRFNSVDSDEHIRTLVRALKSAHQPLQPLLVFPVGKRFFVVDGHHRLAAYRKARWKGPIPVEVFEGTLDDARLAALEGNIRDKLRMSGPEKKEAAWKLVKDGKLSKSEIVKRGVASDGTVSAMRKVLKTLEALKDYGGDLALLSWVEARRVGAEEKESDPEWKTKKAMKIVDALKKAKIGQGFMKDPEVTALALQMLNPKLPGALARQWWFDDPDLKSEMADELRRDDDPYGLLEEPEEPEASALEF
jgi:ParB-like chromosome segregation protein Spo0J